VNNLFAVDKLENFQQISQKVTHKSLALGAMLLHVLGEGLARDQFLGQVKVTLFFKVSVERWNLVMFPQILQGCCFPLEAVSNEGKDLGVLALGVEFLNDTAPPRRHLGVFG